MFVFEVRPADPDSAPAGPFQTMLCFESRYSERPGFSGRQVNHRTHEQADDKDTIRHAIRILRETLCVRMSDVKSGNALRPHRLVRIMLCEQDGGAKQRRSDNWNSLYSSATALAGNLTNETSTRRMTITMARVVGESVFVWLPFTIKLKGGTIVRRNTVLKKAGSKLKVARHLTGAGRRALSVMLIRLAPSWPDGELGSI